MIDDPSCPTCSDKSWQSYGAHAYDRLTIESERGWRQTALKILFDIWAPGAKTFEVEMIGCNRCSLMIFRPRPSEADITAKYAFVGGMGDATPSKGEDPARTRRRANRVARILQPHLPARNGAILDYGGGDGRLLRSFVKNGRPCHLIDYADRPINGVSKVGDTEDDLAGDAAYDAVICSHVVEHLPAPRPALRKLGLALAPDGVMYVEVPYEVFGRLPARHEPVTHVNFFTPESLAALLESAGLEVISSKLTMYPHPSGNWAVAVGALARRRRQDEAPNYPGPAPLRRALQPSALKQHMYAVWRRAGRVKGSLLDRG